MLILKFVCVLLRKLARKVHKHVRGIVRMQNRVKRGLTREKGGDREIERERKRDLTSVLLVAR